MPGSKVQPPGPDFWLSAQPEDLRRRLSKTDFKPGPETAAAIRDRAASVLMSEPAFAYELSLLLQKVVRRHASILSAESLAHAWRCRAEASLFTGRLSMAKRAYERACAEAEAAGSSGLLGQILVGRIHLLSLLGEAEQSEKYVRRAGRLLQQAGDLPYLGKLHMNRGNTFYQLDRYAEALAAYREAARTFESLGLRDATWVGLLMNQAVACTNLSRPGEALRLFREAESHCERLGLDALLAQARFNRAFLETLHGNHRRALVLLEAAEAAFTDQGQRDMQAAVQRSRAEIYLELGLTEDGLELARAAAEGFGAEGMDLDLTLSRLDCVRGLIAQGLQAEAEPILSEAYEFYRRRRIRPRAAQVLLLEAKAALGAGNAKAAVTLATRALRSFEALTMDRSTVEARFTLADALLAHRRAERAASTLVPLLTDPRRLTTAERTRLQALAGKASRQRGRRSEALRGFRRAARLLELQRGLIPGPELRTRAFARQAWIYEELISLLLEAPRRRFRDLFAMLEASRARGFRERLLLREDDGVKADGAPHLARRAELGSLTHRLDEAELAGRASSDPIGTEKLRRRTLGLEKKILADIRRREDLSAGGTSWGETPSPERVAAQLEPDETLLQYFVVGERILGLLLSRDSRTLKVLPGSIEELRSQLERISFQIEAVTLAASQGRTDSSFDGRVAESALRALHASLLAPFQDCLPEEGRLTLIPHGFLHAVPFECLHDGGGYIDERFLLSRAPTTDFLLRRGREKSSGRGRIVIAGNIQSGPAHVGREIEAVARRFTQRGGRPRIVEDPTSADLLTVLPGCRLLHLGTHGRFRADNPLFSRLSTSDGALFLADVAELQLGTELVVLSACETGEVLAEKGDELAGVAHAFLGAGVRRLVASRWRVHDVATGALMDSFYGHYLRHRARDPARALRAAARETRAEWPHPFFWGGFSIFGA